MGNYIDLNRKVIFWLLFTAFFWIIVSRLVQIENLFKTLLMGESQWVLLAALLQLCFYLSFTGIYQSAFHSVGLKKVGLMHLLPITFASIFINVVAPSGGAAGAALFVDDAARRGESPARAAAGVLIKTLADFAAVTLILLAGMLYLAYRDTLRSYQLAGAVIFLLILLALIAVLVLSVRKPAAVGKLLAWVQKLLDRISLLIRRRPALSECWAERSTAELVQAVQSTMEHPARPGRTVLFALASHTFNIASLYAIFRAFYMPVEPGVLIAGYSIALLFLIVSITPMGIGMVEAAMVLVFKSLGISGTVATVVALSFRGIGFWLPFLIGFLVLRRLQTFNKSE